MQIVRQCGMQVGRQPEQPLVEVGSRVGAKRRYQSCVRMGVGQVQRDRGRFIQYEVTIPENRDETVRVELQIGFALVGVGVAVDEDQPVLDFELVQQDVRQQ